MLNWIVWNRTIFIKMDLMLNNLQRLICHTTQPTNQQSLYNCLRVIFCTQSQQIWIIFKLIYLTHRWDLNRGYHSGSEWTWESWQWRNSTLFPYLQNWSRCSLVSYSGHHFWWWWWGSYSSIEDIVSVYQVSLTEQLNQLKSFVIDCFFNLEFWLFNRKSLTSFIQKPSNMNHLETQKNK